MNIWRVKFKPRRRCRNLMLSLSRVSGRSSVTQMLFSTLFRAHLCETSKSPRLTCINIPRMHQQIFKLVCLCSDYIIYDRRVCSFYTVCKYRCAKYFISWECKSRSCVTYMYTYWHPIMGNCIKLAWLLKETDLYIPRNIALNIIMSFAVFMSRADKVSC